MDRFDIKIIGRGGHGAIFDGTMSGLSRFARHLPMVSTSAADRSANGITTGGFSGLVKVARKPSAAAKSASNTTPLRVVHASHGMMVRAKAATADFMAGR